MMLKKLVFLLALMVVAAAAARGRDIQHHQKESNPSTDRLIEMACADDSNCISIVETAPESEKSNATALTFFILRYVEDQAVNVSKRVRAAKVSSLPPMLQSAVAECREQYNSVDDLIDDVVDAMESNSRSDAVEITKAAIGNIDQCHSHLVANNDEERAEDKSDDDDKEDVQWSADLAKSNLLLKKLLGAALNILKKN
ncbi:uncharacterized protein LOC127242985 [Andrographis paniculata]|uniref:uncharacterized protein LOC127242985 n=1 Tax=Andrographis paniculata TaxID=175694 RepID=UPI0021E8165A|nr:uncharacterized protein LOC127242985 [Andrographis paniculata]